MVAGGIQMIDILRLALPITTWLIGFCAVYALQALSCSRHWPADFATRPVLLIAGGIVISLQVALTVGIVRTRSTSHFVQSVAITLAGTAFVAALWTMLPLLAATTCL
jgi:hypothetical protein